MVSRGAASAPHQLLFGTFWTDNIFSVSDESLACHGDFAESTHKALRVPVPALEGDEPRATGASNRLGAGSAPLGKEVPEARGAVRLIVARGEFLTGQHGVTVGACEAVPMPRLVLEGDATGRHDLLALRASRGELLLEAGDAVNVRIIGDDKGLGADRHLTHGALEAFVVPLAVLVLHLLHTGSEDVTARVTPRGELCVVATSAKDKRVLGSERLVDQRALALLTRETLLEMRKTS